MSLFKKLAQETAIYGISSIVGRAMYFMLTPLYTNVIERQLYAESVELFAYTAFFMVIFSYRMETAFFRYGNKAEDRKKSFDTAAASLIYSSTFFTVLLLAFHVSIAGILGYATDPQYIFMLILVLFFDALCELPYAKLRLEGKAIKFAKIRLTNITVNVGFNLFFLLGCPFILATPALSGIHPFIDRIYHPDYAITYIFLSNLIASALQFVLLLPQYRGIQWAIDRVLWMRMFLYASPLILASMAGVINEAFDKALLKWRLPYDMDTNKSLLGEYGGAYKLTIIISLFTQAFRYSAEPFFFRNAERSDSKQIYADVTRYFTIFSLIGFLVVACYIDQFKYLIGSTYWDALVIVPIVLMANVFLGMYYNVSIWYRLADKTSYGAYIALAGAAITISLNWIWIPTYGYIGSAWATLMCYFGMTVLCYLSGRKYYHIPYPLGRMALYILLSVGLLWISTEIRTFSLTSVQQFLLQTALILSFVLVAWLMERKHLKGVMRLV